MIPIYVGTNRRPDEPEDPVDFGPEFSDAGLTDLRFMVAEVELLENEAVDFRLLVAPDQADNGELGSAGVFEAVRKRMADDERDLMLFIHGYNTSFSESLVHAAKLAKAYPGVDVALFAWPSDGSSTPFVAYKDDRHDAAASGPALARAILKLREFLAALTRERRCRQRLILMAHSMGVYVLRGAVVELMKHFPYGTPRIFDEAILVAADEDADAFAEPTKLAYLPGLAHRVTVYHNGHDQALLASTITKLNPPRLGRDGPSHPQYLPENVVVVDCGGVAGGLVEHNYHLTEPAVVRDVRATIAGTDDGDVAGRVWRPKRHAYKLEKISCEPSPSPPHSSSR